MMSSTFSISLAPMPEAGSSRRSSLGAAMSARAICTSWRSVQTRSARPALGQRPPSPPGDRMRMARALDLRFARGRDEGEPERRVPGGPTDRVVDARHDVFDHGQAGYELARLEGAPDALVGDDLRALPRDVFAFETDGAGIGFEHAGDAVEEGGLSRTVRADDAVDASPSRPGDPLGPAPGSLRRICSALRHQACRSAFRATCAVRMQPGRVRRRLEWLAL